MARLNVYVPDELAASARAAGLNVSALTQRAITGELERHAIDAWLDALPAPSGHVSHHVALAALDEASADLAGDRD